MFLKRTFLAAVSALLIMPMAMAQTTRKAAVAATVPQTAGTMLTFQDDARYSELVMNSRLNSFYANKSTVGFGKFDDKGVQTETEFRATTKLDYVPGLVAKAVIEAVDYYKDDASVNVKPWFYAVQNYACKNDIPDNGKAGKSFDDLNGVKLYFVLRELAENKTFADGALYSNDVTVSTADKRLADALTGIRKANETYSIKEGFAEAQGGWFHKSGYVNQMWCDGQYMGPALLAQMIKGYGQYSAITTNDWDLITKQFSICWHYLWDADKELLLHAFSATPTDSYASTWANPQTGVSKEYWGRAEGWYFLALVDVLEEMQKANLTSTDNYKTLRDYLNKVAAGLAKRADSKTGCWYQLLQYDGSFCADSYNGKSYTKTYNYLESSATAIFIAAYLKGQRLGLYDSDYTAVAQKAYKGFVETFMMSDGNGGVHLINSCRSAGLGGSSYRDGSAAYYLLGSDVSMVKASEKQTEGKVLGAFILAATEYERAFLTKATQGLTDAASGEKSWDKPFGFCTRTSRTSTASANEYNVTGGGCYTYPVPSTVSNSKVIVLKSTGQDQLKEIQNAIKNYSVIIFDGSNGEFILSKTCGLSGISNKTLLGINGAKLRSQWFLTDEMRKVLDDANVKSMSTSSGTGGTLSNGSKVSEQAEYNVRQLLINFTGDSSEGYRNAGVFSFSGCQNIIVRNLKFQGPGAVDVSGADLISFTGGTKNCWVDHCEFCDGTDGNFDITQKSDFNTVSWCKFYYTEHSYMHQNTNLVGSSDSETTGYLNTTFAFNNWAEGCKQRMPMARVGLIHMLNNYYTCVGNGASINPRMNSEFLIEGNYFVKGVTIFGQTSAVAWTWTDTNYSEQYSAPASNGTVTVPYRYEMIDVQTVPEVVGLRAGATLTYTSEDYTDVPTVPTEPETPTDPDTPDTPDTPVNPVKPSNGDIVLLGNKYVVSVTDHVQDGRKVIGRDITMTYGNDGNWQLVKDPAAPADYQQRYRAVGANNTNNKTTPTSGTFYVFEPTADGTMDIDAYIYTNKALYVTLNGTAQTATVNGKNVKAAVVNASANYYGSVRFPVTRNNKYYVFCGGSKMGIHGFSFIKNGTTQLLGDADNDGTVTLNDARLVANDYLGTVNQSINYDNADVNGDQIITIDDANRIVNISKK